MTQPLPTGILTYPEVVARAQYLLAGLPMPGHESAAALSVLVKETYGRSIEVEGHEHDHVIQTLHVTVSDAAMTIDVRVSACSEMVTLTFVKALPSCPECDAGKCGNCNGQTWDRVADDVADCPCAQTTDHERRAGR